MDQAAYILKLERRIRNQRTRLRWWDEQFNSRVQSRWARVYLRWRSRNRARYVNVNHREGRR